MRTSPAAQKYKAALEVASRNLKKLSDSGVKIAMGTDTGPPARFQGYFEHMELELMAKAGMTPRQILQAATGDAASCMQMTGRIGTLQPGAWGDLIVLERNPIDDIRNMRTIQSVWIAGNQVPR
jgi:imidazolonepropionase-like amidohydrolase